MSEPRKLLELDRELRRDLEARLALRPWPPPPRSEQDELLARTASRVLHDLADDPPAAFPDCADWLLLVPDESAETLRSELLDARLLVAGRAQWEAIDEASRGALRQSAALLSLEPAAPGPARWAGLLPTGAPTADELVATLGEDAAAVSVRLEAPGFGELWILHAWTRGPDGPVHAPQVSGVLRLRPPH